MDERRKELRLTWNQVAQRGSTTDETLRQVRTGQQRIQAMTMRAVEAGLQWGKGSVESILDGGDPTEGDAVTVEPAGRDAARLLIEQIWKKPGLSREERAQMVQMVMRADADLRTVEDWLSRVDESA
jgi:hypothetical protein